MLKRTIMLVFAAMILLGGLTFLAAQGLHEEDYSSSGPVGAPPGEPGWMHDQQLTAEQEKEVLGHLQQHWPQLYERLTSLRDEMPDRYHQELHRAWRRYEAWRDLPPEAREAQVKLHDVGIEIWRLRQQLGQASTAEQRQALTDQLRQALGRQFDAEHTMQKARLDQMEARLQRLRQELAERAQKRDAIIAERLERTLQAATQPAGPPDDGPGPDRLRWRGPHEPPTQPAP